MKPFFLLERAGRYTVVGTICAVANNGMMILGDFAGAHYVPMMFLSFVIIIPLSYLLHSAFTFHTELSAAGLLRFTSSRALGGSLSLLTMLILCSGLGWRVAIATPVTTVALILWNYASAQWAATGRLRPRSVFGARMIQ